MPPSDKKQELARIIAGRVSQLKAEKIDAVRSKLDQFVGFVTNDTLYRLRQAVADHTSARLPRVRMVASRSFSACATPTWLATASSPATGKRLLSSRTSRPRLWSSGAGGRPKPGTWLTPTPRTQPTPPRRLR